MGVEVEEEVAAQGSLRGDCCFHSEGPCDTVCADQRPAAVHVSTARERPERVVTRGLYRK